MNVVMNAIIDRIHGGQFLGFIIGVVGVGIITIENNYSLGLALLSFGLGIIVFGFLVEVGVKVEFERGGVE